jgi:type IV pilus biogenesis/stability protein PilW
MHTACLKVILSCLFLILVSACASTLTEEDRNQSDLHNKLGISYLSNGHLNEAYVEFQKAIKLDPDNKEALKELGYISTRFAKYDEAISYYTQAISVDPYYSEALNNLGVVYIEMENWDEAIRNFKSALGNPIYSTPEKAYSSMGYAYYKKGDYIEAKKALEEALIRNPIFSPALYTMGLVFIELDDDRSAIAELKKVIGIMPFHVDAHWEIANAYLRAGDSTKALEHFTVVAENEKNTRRSREASQYIDLFE